MSHIKSKNTKPNENIFVEEIRKPEEIKPEPAFSEPEKVEEPEEREEAEYFYQFIKIFLYNSYKQSDKMIISERKLEENEAKIDNILHKVIKSTQQIKELSTQLNEKSGGAFLMDRVRQIKILSEIIYNLASLADEIDIEDENLTKELEVKIQLELDKAIKDITEAKSLLSEDQLYRKSSGKA